MLIQTFISKAPIEPSMLQQLRSGSSATLSMIAGPRGDRMNLDISLISFTDANTRIAA